MRRFLTTMLALLVGVILPITNASAQGSNTLKATASIFSCAGDPSITGSATLTERPSDEGVKLVDVSVIVQGLAPGKHAVHIHEAGDCTPCGNAGGHFDPGPFGNTTPADANHPYHAGDLVNLEVKGTVGSMHATTSRITLSPGPLSVFDANGSAIIIHVNEDTYCPIGEVAGCSGGARLACGILELSP